MLGLSFASCDDDDTYFISTDPVIDASSIATGSSDVTATTATLYGTVKGIEDKNAALYRVGFNYGESQDALTSTVDGAVVKGEGRADGGLTITASLTGLPTGKTFYFQAFITLKNQVTFTGDISSFVTTDATVTTADAASVDFASAVLGGASTGATADAVAGVVISAYPDVEAVRAGLIVPAAEQASTFTVDAAGFAPSTKYYYASYLDLGSGIIYGDVKEFTTAPLQLDVNDEFVDLGLSVKWAKRNLGAKSETDFGGRFGFGDATGVNTSYDVKDYASADIYKTKSDMAWQITGGAATLPSAADFEELFAVCKTEWTEVDGVAGYQVTGPNGNTIFLPAAGSRQVSEIDGEGVKGCYATGSINPADNNFSEAFSFSSTTGSKVSVPVYQALSVRAVSVARNVPFDKTLLYGKWNIDNGQDGKQYIFEGPFTQWGDTDNWNTVTNNYPNLDQQIHWEMGKDNGWIGYTYGKDYGYMEFTEDGKVNIHRIAEDGTVTDETGNYTIDENEKAIDIDIPVLCANTWVGTKSGKLKILALDADGLRIALPNGDGYAYSVNYFNENKRGFVKLAVDSDKVLFVNKDGDDVNGRIEIYNEFGETKNNPPVNISAIKFSTWMSVTFTVTGINDNLKADAAGSYMAAMSYADASWDPSYWGEVPAWNTIVNGDGTYTVNFNAKGNECESAVVWCVELNGLWKDLVDTDKVKVTIDMVKLDAFPAPVVDYALDSKSGIFQNKDGDDVNGRIEIYNEFGDTKNLGVDYSSLSFPAGTMTVEFDIEGIDGNLVAGAAGSYKTELSYADADWGPSYWGGAAVGGTAVTGDGHYTVQARLDDTCEGAVVWCVELYDLWKDLVDTSKVKVSNMKCYVPAAN